MSDEEEPSSGTVVVKRTVKKTTTKTKRVIFSEERFSSSGSGGGSRAGSVEITSEPSTPAITLTRTDSGGSTGACNTPIIIEPDDDDDGGGDEKDKTVSKDEMSKEIALPNKASALKLVGDGAVRFPVGCGGSFTYGESRSQSRQEERQIVSKKGGTITLSRSTSSSHRHRSAHVR